MSTRSEPTSDPATQVSASNAPERRQNLVRILFVNRCLGDVERCLQELKRLRFTVSSDVVLTPEQFVERLRLDVYDTIVAEYPSPNWHETQALDILRDEERHSAGLFGTRIEAGNCSRVYFKRRGRLH